MKKKKMLLIFLIIVTCILILIGNYKNNYTLEIQPPAIAPIYVGIVLCILIAAITYSYGYCTYTSEFEGIFISKFVLSLLIDALLTLMIYAPLII